jgi:tetratricopeptide (TPR) repeat protein
LEFIGFRKLCLLFLIFFSISISVFAQDVIVLMSNGDRVTGMILEYSNSKLKLKTQNGELEIPAENISLIDFSSNKDEISGKAYIHLMKGKQLLELGVEEEAREEFRAAIRESPKYAEAYYEIAKILEKRGQVKQASEYFSRAVSLAPEKLGSVKFFIDAADSYSKKGELKSAAEAYYRVFTDYPDDLSAEYAAYRAGFIFAEDLKDNKKGLAILEEAVKKFQKSPHTEEALYQIGRMYYESGSLQAAESAFNQLISKYPAGIWKDDAHYMLGRVYHKQKRNDEAISVLTKALELTMDPALIASINKALSDCMWTIYKTTDGLPGDNIKALVRDGDYVWIGTADGLIRYNLISDFFDDNAMLKGNSIQTLAADDTFLWVGTSGAGVKRFNKKEGIWKDFTVDDGLLSDKATSISIDSDSVWIGTDPGGVWRYDKYDSKWTNYTTKNGLTSDSVISIASTPYGVWCGTLKGGINSFDNSTAKWMSVPESKFPKNRSVSSISFSSDYLWFAWYDEHRNGASRYSPLKSSWDDWVITEWAGDVQLPGNASNNIIHLGSYNEETWVGVDTGALVYDQKSSSWSAEPINYPSEFENQVPVNVLICNKSLWFATSKGLGRLDREIIDRISQIKK